MADSTKTKAQLQEELDEVQAAHENERAELEARISKMEKMIEEKRAAGEPTGPNPQIYHDPFDTQNPHHINKHPEGKVLSWKNPNYRQQRGWRGWEPVTWDSEIGKNISQYIPDPPAKMEGISKQDNYIRRGTDSVLAAIDEEIWLARQQKRRTKALQKQAAANARANRKLGAGVETFGDGVEREQAPAGGFRRTPEPPMPTGGHRTRLFHPDEE
jgi:hypothetical protein